MRVRCTSDRAGVFSVLLNSRFLLDLLIALPPPPPPGLCRCCRDGHHSSRVCTDESRRHLSGSHPLPAINPPHPLKPQPEVPAEQLVDKSSAKGPMVGTRRPSTLLWMTLSHHQLDCHLTPSTVDMESAGYLLSHRLQGEPPRVCLGLSNPLTSLSAQSLAGKEAVNGQGLASVNP